MDKKDRVKITEYTDTMCFWCYAIEPVVRKVEYLMGDKLDTHFILGLLISDMRDIVGHDELAEARFAKTRVEMTQHIVSDANRYKIPISPAFFENAAIDEFSSAPLNMAYKAFHIQDPEHAHAFMRRMREAIYSEGRVIAREGELAKIAGEFGIDVERFEHDRTSDIVEEIYSQDLVTTSKQNVRTYPSFSVMYNGKERSATGYCEFAFFQHAIEEVTDGEIKLETPEYSLAEAAKFVTTYGRVMEREIQVLFDIDDEKLRECVSKLVESGEFEREAVGSGYFIKAKEGKKFCDPITGACSII